MLNMRSVMASYDLLDLAKTLATEFQRRSMAFHLESLRRFYGHIQTLRSTHDEWDEKMIVEWLALFGVEPFGRQYPVRPSGSACTTCKTKVVRVNVVTIFPGGSKRSCLACGTEWVERAAG
jgi:hypothetical protein